MRKIIILSLVALISGCALVQWLPLSSCEKVKYERVGNKVKANMECEI
jgi:hypothetical protein